MVRGIRRKLDDPREVNSKLPSSLAIARGSEVIPVVNGNLGSSSAPVVNGNSVLHSKSVLTVDIEIGQLTGLLFEVEANLGNSREVNATLLGSLATTSGSEVMHVMNGNSGLSFAPIAKVLNPKDSASDPLVTYQETPFSSLQKDLIFNMLDKILASEVDLSNPFFVLEHCSVVEPVFSSLLPKNP
ncbi:hypothetical protein AAC387_Pa04g1069 [Persea americana]